MHPLLKPAKRIVFVIIAWVPVTLGIAYIHKILNDVSFSDALMLMTPIMILEFFFFLAVWFICRITPLSTSKIFNFIVRHLITIVVMSALWLHLSMMYSESLNILKPGIEWRAQYDKTFPVLMVFGFFMYFVSALLSYLFLTIEQARTAEKNALENALKASEAELKSLKATLHPHFLFNSLTALSTLIRTSSDKAQEACIQLSDFLRYSLSFSKKNLVPLNDEIKHIQNYLAIEKIRLGNRLVVEYNIDNIIMDVLVPTFCLQPLIENSIKHGIEPSLNGGTVYLEISKTGDNIYLEVRNPYPKTEKSVASTGHGLINLKSRLEKVFKDEGRILIHKGSEVFTVKLFLPIINKSNPVTA